MPFFLNSTPKLNTERGQAAAMILIGLALVIGLTLASASALQSGLTSAGISALQSGCNVFPAKETRFTALNKVTYVVRRVNFLKPVGFAKEHIKKTGEKVTVDGKNFEIYISNRPGGIAIKPAFIDPVTGIKKGSYNFEENGIIFLRHLDVDDPKTALFDVYQDISKPPMPDFLISCADTTNVTINNASAPTQINQEVIIPSQSPSIDHKQQQLEYFVFEEDDSIDTNITFQPHCKPAIYLYPKETTQVNVKVNTKGKLTYTDPPYPDEGWNVIAYPDGKLYLASSLLPLASNYLYYESKVPDELIDVPNKGYTVSFSQLPNLYQTILPELGLNEAQTKDFINYWTKTLPYSPYYFVGIMDQENINDFEPLNITPKPDTINRVRVYFKTLDKKVKVNEPVLQTLSPQPSALSKFSVTEWGGMFKNDPLHPFTCSE